MVFKAERSHLDPKLLHPKHRDPKHIDPNHMKSQQNKNALLQPSPSHLDPKPPVPKHSEPKHIATSKILKLLKIIVRLHWIIEIQGVLDSVRKNSP